MTNPKSSTTTCPSAGVNQQSRLSVSCRRQGLGPQTDVCLRVAISALLACPQLYDTMIYAHLPDLLSFLRHVNNEPIDKPARSARLIIDGLDGGGHNFKVVMGLQSFVHLCLIPELFE